MYYQVSNVLLAVMFYQVSDEITAKVQDTKLVERRQRERQQLE